MNLKDLTTQIQKKIILETGVPPSAIALIGSRVIGYNNPKSDYDITTIFDKGKLPQYINFYYQDNLISVQTRTKEKFKDNLLNKKNTLDQMGFTHLPYKGLEGEEYIFDIEEKSRKKFIQDLIKSFPEKKLIKINLEQIAEYPLINMAIKNPEYTNRLRRLTKIKNSPIEIMIPKYHKTIKELGYEINSKGEVIFQNLENEENLRANPIKKIVERIINIPKRNLTPLDYLAGGTIIISQVPYILYNSFEIFPKFEKEGEFLKCFNPNLKEFANKRKKFIPIEELSKKLKDKIIRSLTEKPNSKN